MGRRSINTTKSGKYMNPTDQARKEARKRELKKNKKQRQMVRAAVLKGKDPAQIIMEMEKMDQMEFCVEGQPLLSEKVLKDKRKKLRETLDRVLKLYEKEDPEYWVEIRRMESEYEKKRLALIEYFESVRHAQAVTIDEIPLPNLDMPGGDDDDDDDEHDMLMQEEIISVPPIPNAHLIPAHGILKKPPVFIPPVRVEPKDPPGCPPTLPPDLSEDEDEEKSAGHVLEKEKDKKRTIKFKDVQDSDEEAERKGDDKGDSGDDDGNDDEDDDDDDDPSKTNKNLTNLQTKLLQMSGQDIDDFMRETEVLFREKEAERKADLIARLDGIKDDEEPQVNLTVPPPGIAQMKSGMPPIPPLGIPPRIDGSVPQGIPTSQVGPQNVIPVSGSASHGPGPPTVPGAPVMPLHMPSNPVAPPGIGLVPPVGPPGIAPPLMMRPPPSRPGMPPPPLGIRLPPGLPPQGLPPRLSNMRLPPPVPLRPTIRPPGGIPTIPPPGLPLRVPPPGHNPNVLSAGPQLIARPREDEKKSSATIEAKPQIRSNLSADVTRFLPTALRVKREDKKKASKAAIADMKEFPGSRQEETDRKPTKDDAYSQFMKEMEGLL